MPKRPRAHQLEDLSKTVFKKSLPPEWVARDKSHDYGIDLEVELFDDDGASTGLMFFVQLRATDSEKRASYLDFNIEQIEYFKSLDAPTAVFRYHHPSQTFRWKWYFNFDLAGVGKQQQSLRVKFDDKDVWGEQSAVALRRTLDTLRRIRTHHPSERVLVNGVSTAANPTAKYQLDRAIDDAIALVSVLAHDTNLSQGIVASVTLEPNVLRLAIDQLSSVTFEIGESTAASLKQDILFGLCLLFSRHRMNQHATAIAIALSATAAKHNSRFLVAEVAGAIPGAMASAKFAIANNLHQDQDHASLSFVYSLIANRRDDKARGAALDFFLQASAKHELARGNNSAAAASLYSLGNYYRSNHQTRLAVRHYHKAKKLYPSYIDKRYFVFELAGCLFLQRRYKCALELYRRSIPNEPSAIERLCFGDALLFSGQIADAKRQFDLTTSDTDVIIAADANIKSFICHWLISEYGASTFDRRVSMARRAAETLLRQEGPSRAEFVKILRESDPLNEVCNFSVAATDAEAHKYESAFARFAICAVSAPNDHTSWANAIYCAFDSGNSDLVLGAIAAAAMHSGPDGYGSFRSLLEAQNIPADALSALDEINRELTQQMRGLQLKSKELVMRLLRDPTE